MRLWVIKFVILFGAIACQSPTIDDKEYDLAFDVQKSRLPQKRGTIISGSHRSAASWRIGMQALLFPDFLKGSGELVYGNFAENSNTGFSDRDKYLLKLGVGGKQNIFGYGFDFYSVGRRFDGKFNSEDRQKKGRTGYESWLSWNIVDLQIKTKFSESWTNNRNNPSHVRTLDRWHELETSYPLSSEPYTRISFSYGLGERLRTIVPDDAKVYEGPLNSLKAKFRFDDDYLKFSAGINRFGSQNDLDTREGFQQDIYYINGTFFPRYFLSIITSYRYSVNIRTSTAYKRKLNNMASSLGLVYKSIEIPGHLKFTSAYNNYRSDDGLTNRDIVNFGAQFDWKSWERYTGLKTDWTLDLRFRDIRDYVNPTTNSSDWSFNLLWRWPLS